MKNLLFILIIILNINCASKAEQYDTELSFIDLAKSSLHGAGREGIKKSGIVIQTQKEWQELLAKMKGKNSLPKQLTDTSIDFSKQTVIAVFTDVLSSGGYSININTIVNKKDFVEVTAKTKRPSGPAIFVMTQPYHIVLVDKITKKVAFTFQ